MKVGRFCRRCLYDLSGWVAPAARPEAPGATTVARCPECGRGFDPEDANTTFAKARPLWMRIAMGPLGRCSLLLGVLLFLFLETWLPRPLDTRWRMWVWLDKQYGRQVNWIASKQMTVSVRADRARRITAVGEDSAPELSVETLGDDHWRVDVLGPKATWTEVMAVMNSLALLELDFRFDAEQPEGATAAFSVEGDASDVVRGLIKGFRLKLAHQVTRLGVDEWKVEVMDGRVRSAELFGAFNALRDWRYGVFTLEPGPMPESVQTFSVQGNEADIFWAIVNAYGLNVDKPWLVPARSDGWHPTGDPRPDPQPAPKSPRRLRGLVSPIMKK